MSIEGEGAGLEAEAAAVEEAEEEEEDEAVAGGGVRARPALGERDPCFFVMVCLPVFVRNWVCGSRCETYLEDGEGWE